MLQTVTPFILRVCRSADRLRRFILLLVLAALLPAARAAEAAAKRHYDLAAGDAATTLRQFVEQSGEQVIYLVTKVRGVKTNPVKGEFTAREVLDRMVSNTGLVVVRDEKTGALLVNRAATAEQPASPPAPSRRAAEEAAPKSAPVETKSFLSRVGAALALFLSPAVHAADGAVPMERPAEAIQLSPFTVSTDKDTGYLAADVMSGSRLATNLLKTASDVTVLTRDFLDDIGANNIQDVQLWLTGSDPSANTINATNPTDFGTAAGFRGLPGTTNTRNYWRNDFAPEEYITERLEGSRGPNGILYGDATQSGKVNVMTKRAAFRDFGSVRLRFDGFGEPFGRGIYFDLNRKLTDRWAARVNLQDKKGAQWYDRSQDDHVGAQFTTTYRPWRGGEVRFELAKDLIRRTNLRPDALFDTQSRWDRVTTTNGPITAAPAAATGLSRFGSDTWVYIAGVGVQNWRNFAQTTGTNISALTNLKDGRETFANFPVVPYRKFNINSPLEKIDAHQVNENLTFEQQFDSGLVVELAGNYAGGVRVGDTLFMSNSYIDVNRVLPNGQANPNFLKTYSDTNGWNPIRTGSYTSGVRLAAAYPWKTAMFSQTFSVVAEWRERLDAFKAWQYFRDNGALAPSGLTSATPDNNQRVLLRRYWDNPEADAILPLDDATNKYRWMMSRDQHTTNHLRSVQASTVGSYFRDSLTVVAGIRHDEFHGATRDIQRRDTVTGEPTAAGGIWSDARVNTPQIAATYFPIRQVGVYAFKSNGFLPSTINTPKLDGSPAYNLAVSRSWGGGLRFNLADRRLVGSIGFYDSAERDRNTQITLGTLNGIWTAVGNAGGPNNQIIQTGGLAQYTDVSTVRAWGWEGELTANLARGLRLTINASLPHTKQTDGLRDTRAYYTTNLPVWSRYRTVAAVNNAMQTLENLLAGSVDGRPQNGLYRYRINAFANYTFQQGMLKNFRVGGGANIFGEQIIGNTQASPFEFVYADAYYLVTATLGYSLKVREHPVDLHLSFGNVLNYQEPIYRQGLTVVNNVAYRSAYYWPVPRSVQFTTTVRF
jgi:outer membrane receptor for ferric coprogen and ferric-rhodotorulic acid